MKIIAEIGASHLGKYDIAESLIGVAKQSGADAVKLQCFDPDQMAVSGYTVKSGPWAGRELLDLYREAQTPREWFPRLFDYGRGIGIEVFSSVYHPDDIDYLESLGCPAYKIASFEAGWHALVRRAVKTGKEVYVSTGLLTLAEINALDTEVGHAITTLHCVSAYPAREDDCNLAAMDSLWLPYGLSDHTRTSLAAQMAVAAGAVCVEKHIGVGQGLDAGFSLLPDQFERFVSDVRRAERLWGSSHLDDRVMRESSLALRRSLHPDMTVRRPWSGVSPNG